MSEGVLEPSGGEGTKNNNATLPLEPTQTAGKSKMSKRFFCENPHDDGSDPRPLLILDMDETLIHSMEMDKELVFAKPHFMHEEDGVYKRPNLDEFLKRCAVHYRIAIWSAGRRDYVFDVISQIVPETMPLEFVWTRGFCTRRKDGETQEEYYLKVLKKLEKRGYDLDRVLIVEDSPRNCARNYGNAIYVNKFLGVPNDNELLPLASYLEQLASQPNFRRIEKRDWRMKTGPGFTPPAKKTFLQRLRG